MNAKTELLKLADGETILAIGLGEKGYRHSDQPPDLNARNYIGQQVEQALDILDFEFDSSFGGEEGYSLYAWTKTKVIVKGTYDGSEWYEAIPRNPPKVRQEYIEPQAIGGG